MVVDFHTHAFPDDLAEKALTVLTNNLRVKIEPVHNGTVTGLLQRMEQWKVDVSVVLPIVTKLSQTKSLNQWAASIASDKIIPFGSIFPHSESYKQDLDFVANLGLRGIKFHAEYQDFVIDEPRMLRIYDYALSKGLVIVHHAGEDEGMPPPYKSSPEQFANIVDSMQGGVIVAAHLGGYRQWQKVFEVLAGKNIYLDTSMGFDYYDTQLFLNIVKKHGSHKILFASDSPWSSAGHEIASLMATSLSNEAKNQILFENACSILGITSTEHKQ